jgi:hypothetical protein
MENTLAGFVRFLAPFPDLDTTRFVIARPLFLKSLSPWENPLNSFFGFAQDKLFKKGDKQKGTTV